MRGRGTYLAASLVHDRAKLVADAMQGADHRVGPRFIEGAAKAADPCRQDRIADRPTAPDFREQLLFGDRASPVLHQIAQQLEGLRFDVHRRAVAFQEPSRHIHLAGAEPEDHGHPVRIGKVDERQFTPLL